MEQRVPVIVGVGQIANKDTERVLHPADLLEIAARRALDDAGAAVAESIEAVYSSPISVFSDMSGSAMVADRLGLMAGPRVVDPGYSGTGPLVLMDQACRAIADGHLDAALILGGVADASVRRARARGEEPPAPPGMPLSLGSGGGSEGLQLRTATRDISTAEAAAGVSIPAA